MPTANRRRYVPRAIRYFQAQDYPNKELVILDDGSESVADLVPDDPQLRYARLTGQRTLGAKRNECVMASRGDLIMHWDDDDWMAPHRISYQVEALLREGADVCGLRRMLFHELATGSTWLYDYPANERPWLAGGSLLYTRDFWRRAPFPNIQVGSDTRFVWSQRLERAAVLPDYRFYVAMIHPGNTSPKQTKAERWRPYPAEEIRNLMGQDWSFYIGLGQGNEQAVTMHHKQQNTAALYAAHEEAHMLQAHRCPVTVSIPYFKCKSYIRRAVESILHQTHPNLTLVLVNDGDADPPWDQLAHIDDPRLIRFNLQANHGRYFADAVVLNATTDPYFMIQDADDWSEPTRLAVSLQQLRADHADAAISACYRYRIINGKPDQRQKESCLVRTTTPLTEKFQHRLWHYGLFKVESLRNIGGYYGGFRIGYDTLLMNLVMMTGKVSYIDEPLYNRLSRPDSLVNCHSTGLRSPARIQATQQLQRMYSAAFARYKEYLAGAIEAEVLAGSIGQLCESHITSEDRQDLAAESNRLWTMIRARQEPTSLTLPGSAIPSPATPGQAELGQASGATSLDHLFDDQMLGWAGWTIGKSVAVEIANRLATLRPRRVLELGSGNSTAVLAACAAHYDIEVITLEHEEYYYDQTRRMLTAMGLMKYVDLKLAPLQAQTFRADITYPWYSTELSGRFDFVLVDGPPEKYGRQAVLFALAQHLDADWELWLHDGNRQHEQRCVELWMNYFQFSSSLHPIDDKGVWILKHVRNHGNPEQVQDFMNCLGISFLTGGRLELFKRTVESLQTHISDALKHTFTIVMVNGPDSVTRKYVDDLWFVDRCIDNAHDIKPVGVAMSLLMQELISKPSIKYILHLEDDWSSSAQNGQWLNQACQILKNHPDIGQVRLRHSSEKVLNYHMITKKPIIWEQRELFSYAKSAHFTFNPSLIRAKDAPLLFPCRSEEEAQRKYLATGMATVQLLPGIFFHIGAKHSLCAKLGR